MKRWDSLDRVCECFLVLANLLCFFSFFLFFGSFVIFFSSFHKSQTIGFLFFFSVFKFVLCFCLLKKKKRENKRTQIQRQFYVRYA